MDIITFKELINNIEPFVKDWNVKIYISRSLVNYISTPKQKFNKNKILKMVEDGDNIRIIDLTKNREKTSVFFHGDKISIYHKSKYCNVNNEMIFNLEDYKKAFDILNEFIVFDTKLDSIMK